MVVSARAYADNEVAFIAWTLGGVIPVCVGFDVTRIYLSSGEECPLATWVPFAKQANPDWRPQNTRVWPIQKLTWRDLTLRRRRDKASLRPSDVAVRYRVRPLAEARPGLQPVEDLPAKTYQGDPIPLAYLDEGIVTNDIVVTTRCGAVKTAFTNGMLSAQWLQRALEERGEPATRESVKRHIQMPGDWMRRYLAGDVLGMLTELLERAEAEGGHVALALYELSDDELLEALLRHKDRIRLILSNSGVSGGGWDGGNAQARERLRQSGAEIHDRMFNNGRIGHNKFAVLVGGDGVPRAVMTGSTNWTATGLCSQSNNVSIIEGREVASDYLGYWELLLADTKELVQPNPLSAPTNNCQGLPLRLANGKSPETRTLSDGTRITSWYSPNTKCRSKKAVAPPDLRTVYALMEERAKHAILFACFLPSRSGKLSVIEQAVQLGMKDPSLLVYGAISDATAMPNFVPAEKPAFGEKPVKAKRPATFDQGGTHIVRAAALTDKDLMGSFEKKELLTVGQAIIHDKIVVVDPLSEDGFVVMGSHNLGYKASYENDENLVIVEGNRDLVLAYAVHVLDVYDHYRFRARQQGLREEGKKAWDGFLRRDDSWLTESLAAGGDALARYLGG